MINAAANPPRSAPRSVLLNGIVLGMNPGLAIRPMQQMICFLVMRDALFLRVPFERAAGLHCQIREDAACRRDVALFDIGYRPAARIDCREERRECLARAGGCGDQRVLACFDRRPSLGW